MTRRDFSRRILMINISLISICEVSDVKLVSKFLGENEAEFL